MTSPKSLYPDLPIAAQIIRNAPLLTFFLSGEPATLSRCIPPPLSLHREARLGLNMWFLPDADEMTGFGEPGPMGITYLAAEIAGEEGASADGALHFPGRLWLEHWSSSSAARRYARRASGLEIKPGNTSFEFRNDRVIATLLLGDQAVVKAGARIGHHRTRTCAGHSIYYAERDAETGAHEVARFQIPWVSDSFDASDAFVDFDFPDREGASRFTVNGSQTVIGVGFRRITLVPYLASNVVGATVPAAI